jgi:hypothetical protein
MRSNLLFLLFLPAPACFGVDLWTPVIGSGYCSVVAATNATPVRITVASISRCSVVENATIWVQGVNNNGSSATRSSANIHMEDASDSAGLCRVAKNVTGNRFDLYKCDGTTPVASNGIYAYGGQIALAQLRTLKDLPITWFDGAGGYLANCLVNTGAGGCAQTGRPEYTKLLTTLAGLPSLAVPHHDYGGGAQLAAALGWWSENKPESSSNRTKLVNGLMNSLPVPTTACDGSTDCSYSPSGYSDYAYEVYPPGFIPALNLGMAALSPGQKATLERYYLGDYPWTKGGHNYTGTTLAFPSFKPATGTISFAAGSTAISGAGTVFLTEVAPGDYILLRYNESYARWYSVASIESDTALTLARAVDSDLATGTGFGFRLAAPWADNGSDIGYLGWSHMNYYTMLCGAGLPDVTHCLDYSPGSGGNGLDAMHNHQLGRLSYLLTMALTWAATGISPRAEWLATDAMFLWYHNLFPAQTQMGGFSADSAHYHITRILPYMTAVMGGLQNSFTDNPDYTGGGANGAAWWDEIAKFTLHTFVPGRTVSQFQHNGEGSAFACCDSGVISAMNLLAFKPLSTFAAGLKYYIQNDWGEYQNSGYYQNRPDIAAARTPQTSLITTAPLAPGCATQWTAAVCGTDRRFFFASRSGTTAANAWNGNGLTVFYNMQSTARRDHAGQLHEVGPTIAANGQYLLAGDGYLGLFDTIPHGNVLVIGAESNLRNGGSDGVGVSAPMYAHGTPTVAAAGVSLTGHYKSAANVTAYRSIIHAKASGLGYIILRDDFTSAASVTAQTYNHYNVSEGCGTPSASTCTTLDRAARTVIHAKSTARINTSFLGGTVDTANASDTDGSYPSQAGNTFRVTHALTGTSGSLFAIHQVSAAVPAAMPAIVESASAPFKVIEIQDPTAPVVAVIAPVATLNLTGAVFSTTHAGTGQYVVTGLASGNYVVKRNGTEISSPIAVTPEGHVLSFTSISGDFVIDTGPPPLSILTTQLPNAVLGKQYLGTLVGNSGTMPYTWDITSGSLCAGLALTPGSPNAVVGGVAQNLETCTFTVRVQDLGNAETFSRTFTITVVPQGSGTVTILTPSLPAARTGDTYVAVLQANLGTPPYHWSLSAGLLCSGLALDPDTGIISGAATGSGDCTFTIRATDLGNEFAQRTYTITRIPDRQTPLYISTAQASYSAAVVRFGRRGLAFNQSCTLDIRLGGPAGSVIQSLPSASGPSRRQLIATGLPAGQVYHLTATCGSDAATASFETGFPPPLVRPVTVRFVRPTLNGTPVDALVSFGPTEAMANSITTPCTSTHCSVVIDTADPLLYWRVRYRDGSGGTLAQSAIQVIAPR